MDLLEREPELAAITDALRRAAAGEGSVVALAGDSGTGKTSVLEAALCTDHGLRVLRGACDPLATPRPLGPFRDAVLSAGLPPLAAGEEMLSSICEDLYAALGTTPTVLVVEDLHWVDAASVDVLRFLARRVESLPLVIAVTYRDHEIGPRHSARALLGDLARADTATRLPLAPLSLDAVRSIVEGTPLEAESVHALTGGNPFFVVEVATEPDGPLPGSVRDAVLARTVGVGPEDFEVLQLVACAPDRLDDRLLPALGVDLPTLSRLDATGMLGRERGGLRFRHELARQAVESTIPPGGAPVLHARLLEALERADVRDPAVLTHHAVAAGDRGRAVRYARQAAEEAGRAGSHTEAAAFYRTALAMLTDEDPATRAELMQRLSFELYMTSRLVEALDVVRASFRLWQEAGDVDGLAFAHETAAVYEYYSAHRREAEAHLEHAMEIAGPQGDERRRSLAFAGARATRGYLAFHRHDLEMAKRYITDADEIAEAHRDASLGVRSALLKSVVDLSVGADEARTALSDRIEDARGRGLDELASTGYSNLAYLDVEQRRLRSAEHVLEESLPFTVERDIPICRHWQTAVRSRLRLLEGRWSAALEDAAQVVVDGGMPLARLWPLVVRGLVALRSGSDEDTSPLDDAWELVTQLDERARRLGVLAALAERQWMTGVTDERVTVVAPDDLATWAGVPGTEWAAGDLAVWLCRLGLLDQLPDGVAEPYRLTLSGRHAEAASWFRQAGDPFSEALCLVDSPDLAVRARGVEALDKIGATGTADRVRVELRQAGVPLVPPRPRESTRANPGGLTNRQLDVARLVARGLTNAEIAARLYISPKTADHHVSAVLAKLGVPHRRAVVVRADELGLT